ncbi:MAG: substrate-binding domain-containing protein [Clostridia bacterium]|nr:substrate-binding domain-containing protein [Clostridia bacterium]
MKRMFALGAAALMAVSALAGCSGETETTTTTDAEVEESFSGTITVCSREDGSGTRGAFIELFGVEQKNEDGEKVDYTTLSAEITQSTGAMKTSIAGNKLAIGYMSLGSLDDTVKAVDIDGVEATTDNVKNGTYKVSRPFNIVLQDEISDAAQDFVNYIMSSEGQAIVEEENYISEGSTGSYIASGATGSVTVAGSSSVSPLMEKLAEAYMAVNPDVTVEVQMNDSTTGVTSAIEGRCDIGMASRELKDEEVSQGVSSTAIALDGIAVVVNLENPVDALTSEQVKNIFTGEVTDWSEIAE